MNNALWTNKLRFDRTISASPDCTICNAEETSLHILRDCTKNRGVWSNLCNKLPTQFWITHTPHEWLSANLSSNFVQENKHWNIYFAIACSKIWQDRNAHIFQQKETSTTELLFSILGAARDAINTFLPDIQAESSSATDFNNDRRSRRLTQEHMHSQNGRCGQPIHWRSLRGAFSLM